MAGPAKKRAQAEKKSSGSSDAQSSSNDRTQRSSPKAIAPLDGNMDPDAPRAVTHMAGRVPADYTNAKDLKNISDFLGMAGWYTARGVSRLPSPSTLVPILADHACRRPCKRLDALLSHIIAHCPSTLPISGR
jgi:hypothetical protein